MAEQVAHYRRLRGAALEWLSQEDDYQFGKFNLAYNLDSLKDGLGDIWWNEFGNYPLRARMWHEDPATRLKALQAAGKTAATARGLWATLINIQIAAPIKDVSAMTLKDLQYSFPEEKSEFGYVGKPIAGSPLEQTIQDLDASLPRPVRPNGLPLAAIERARQVCLAASQLFMDYLIELCPPDQPIVLPRGGLSSTEDIQSWYPEV
jgi:hypothetical protein